MNKLVLSTMLRKKREEAERMKEKDQCSDIPLSLKSVVPCCTTSKQLKYTIFCECLPLSLYIFNTIKTRKLQYESHYTTLIYLVICDYRSNYMS